MAAPTKQALDVNGFIVMPVKFGEKNMDGHFLYLKENSMRGTDALKPNGKTLFVLNVPPYVTKSCLESLFSEYGRVMKVFTQPRPSSTPAPDALSTPFFSAPKLCQGFQVAYVVFKNASSVKKALTAPFGKARALTSSANTPLTTGLKKWCREYDSQPPRVPELQREIDSFMSAHDQRQLQEAEKAKSQEGVADEEGWITVTRHTKANKAAPFTQAHEERLKAQHGKKAKEKELLNFYAFQIRESKREHIAQLRQKFEEDKQRIALMKAARKFRPY